MLLSASFRYALLIPRDDSGIGPALLCLPDAESGCQPHSCLALHSLESVSEAHGGAGGMGAITRGLCMTAVSGRAAGVRRGLAVWTSLCALLGPLPELSTTAPSWGEAAEAAARAWLRAAAMGLDPLVPGSPLRARRGPSRAAVPRSALSHELLCLAYFTPRFALALDEPGHARGFAWDGDDVYSVSAAGGSEDTLAVERLAPANPAVAAVRALLKAAGASSKAEKISPPSPEAARRNPSFKLPLRGFPAHIAGGSLRAAADAAIALMSDNDKARSSAGAELDAAGAPAELANAGAATPDKSTQSPPPPPLPASPPILQPVSSETSLATLIALSRMHVASAHQLQRMLAAAGGTVSDFSPRDSRPLTAHRPFALSPSAGDDSMGGVVMVPPLQEPLIPASAAANADLMQQFATPDVTAAAGGTDIVAPSGRTDDSFRHALIARTLAHSSMLCSRIDAVLQS